MSKKSRVHPSHVTQALKSRRSLTNWLGRQHMSGIRSLLAIELRPKNFVRAAAAEQKSCFDLAENFKTSSLWVAGHRYTRISCVSKLLWV